MGKSTISMAIFHCYASSPEGIDMFDNFTMFNHVSPQICPVFGFSCSISDVFSFFGPASSNNVLNIPAIQYAPIPRSSRKLEWSLLVFEEKNMPFLRFVF